jgi:hypothetical protein
VNQDQKPLGSGDAVPRQGYGQSETSVGADRLTELAQNAAFAAKASHDGGLRQAGALLGHVAATIAEVAEHVDGANQ